MVTVTVVKLPSEIAVLTPAENASEIPVIPSFSWTPISASEGDTVFYKVVYSTNKDFTVINAEKSDEVKSAGSVLIAGGKELAGNTNYYYEVIGYTKTIPADTVKSVVRSFTTINNPPVVTLISPINNATKVNPTSGVLQFKATDQENGTLKYSVVIADTKENLKTSNLRKDNLTIPSCSISDISGVPFLFAKKYYWIAIASDNGIIPKSDTSDIDSFYTLNNAPVWTAIQSGSDSLYNFSIDLSTYCRDPEKQPVSYKVLTGSAKVNGTILTFESDSQLITIEAVDTFSIQPGSSQMTFRRWYSNPLDPVMQLIPAKNSSFLMGTDSVFKTLNLN